MHRHRRWDAMLIPALFILFHFIHYLPWSIIFTIVSLLGRLQLIPQLNSWLISLKISVWTHRFRWPRGVAGHIRIFPGHPSDPHKGQILVLRICLEWQRKEQSHWQFKARWIICIILSLTNNLTQRWSFRRLKPFNEFSYNATQIDASILMIHELYNLWSLIISFNDNDNDDNNDYFTGLIHRTDFFPGLGWMLLKKLWLELEPIWPDGWVDLDHFANGKMFSMRKRQFVNTVCKVMCRFRNLVNHFQLRMHCFGFIYLLFYLVALHFNFILRHSIHPNV